METIFHQGLIKSGYRVHLLIFLIQFLFSVFGVLLLHLSGGIITLWATSGVALFFCLKYGNKSLSGIFTGTIAGTLFPFFLIYPEKGILLILISSVIFGLGNLIIAFAGTKLIEKYVLPQSVFYRVYSVARYILIVLLISITGSFSAYFSLITTGLLTEVDILLFIVNWWLATVVGILLFTSLFLSFYEKVFVKITWVKATELFLLVIFLMIAEYLLINGKISHSIAEASPYFLISFLLWIAFRNDYWILFLFVLIISLGIVLNNIFNFGLFAHENMYESVLMVQISIGGLSSTLLLISVAINRLRFTQEEIQRAKNRLEIEVKSQTGKLARELEIRKATETALRESEDRYRKLSDLAFEGIVLHNEGKVIDVNKAFIKMTGYSRDEIIGQDIFEKIASPEYLSLIKDKISTDNTDPYIIKLKRKDGKILYAEVVAKKVRYHGETIRAKAIRDITEKIEEKLELTKLHTAIEQSGSSILITDINGNIEYVNPAFLKVSGYSMEEVIGKNPKIFKTDYHNSEYYKTLWKSIMKGQTWRGEFKNRKKNGEIYWEEATITPVLNENNRISNFIAIKDDITERKKGEDILSEWLYFIELINKISSSFISINVEEIDKEIEEVLHFVAEYIGADRGYIIQNISGKQKMILSHVYCGNGISVPDNEILNIIMQHKLFDRFFTAKSHVRINRASIKNSGDDKSMAEFLDITSAISVISLPIRISRNHSGFVVFENLKEEFVEHERTISAFSLTGKIIGIGIERK